MTRPPKVSIALATYNGAQFLPAQLESYLAQTRLPDELVVGDDSSSDETAALIGEFAARAPFPVHLTINPVNLGPARNFMATVLRCAGDAVLLSDQDDVWQPTKIAAMISFMAAHPDKWMALHDARIVDAAGKPIGLTLGGQIRDSGGDPAASHLAGCCMALDARLAALFAQAGQPRLHDSWIEPIARRLGLVAYLDEPLIDYRRHGGNVSGSFVSNTHRVGWASRLAYRVRTAYEEGAEKSLRHTLAWTQEAAAAIVEHRAVLGEAVAEEQICAALAELDTMQGRVSHRLAFHQAHGGAARLAALRACWSAGDYRGAAGKASLLRDLAAWVRTRRGSAQP